MEQKNINTLSAAKAGNPVKSLRKSVQSLLPVSPSETAESGYKLYPFHSLGSNAISEGYASLANWMAANKTIILEGYGGVYWDLIRDQLSRVFEKNNTAVKWHNINSVLKPECVIEEMVAPFLGTPDAVWGTKTVLDLPDFFEAEQLKAIVCDPDFELNIVYGTGASLVSWENAALVYCDVPKNEIQYRMRTGNVFNLGRSSSEDAGSMYKRCYFVDWVILNGYKRSIIDQISVIADAQSLSTITWAESAAVLSGLKELSESVFRVRPWFEAGVWGGQWMKAHIPQLNQDEVNYAWSFELIVPENGLVFESDNILLEVSFDFLMFRHYKEVLGRHAAQFGTEFPIRFDFLDTFEGQHLSVQCHPRLKYIQENFGETITQDETYYILDCKDDAQVYLGFQEDINEAEFKQALEYSQQHSVEIDIEKYVQVHTAEKHDLFLIPNGTVHSAGKNNQVLEISATPYIFTFKMYDWMRLGLDGKPRPININHAFNNLDFERKGEKVIKELISAPAVIEQGDDWELHHLPTHPEHFYDVHRIDFETEVTVNNDDVCHILMLVEGSSLEVQLGDGTRLGFSYAETFVVSANAKSYKLINTGINPAKVIKAFVKY